MEGFATHPEDLQDCRRKDRAGKVPKSVDRAGEEPGGLGCRKPALQRRSPHASFSRSNILVEIPAWLSCP